MGIRWRMLGLAFLSQNLALGITFGSYGLLMGDLAEDFAASRSTVSFGLGLITLSMGLVSPLLGRVLDSWSIRNTMIIGALLSALGFQLTAHAGSLGLFLFYFGVVVGVGVTALGILPASKLAANWFPGSTGKALGFVTLPALIALGPPLFGSILADVGWRQLFIIFSYVYLALIPLLFLIKDKPAAAPAAPTSAGLSPALSATSSLRDPRLWALVLIGGVMFPSGVVIVTHIVQHALGQGMELGRASWLLSINGMASVAGGMLFGWLCDRLTPVKALTINLALQATAWTLLLFLTNTAGLTLGVIVIGLCNGGTFAALSALAGRLFGIDRLASSVGQMQLLIIPFTFGAAPLAGYLFDISGSYRPAFALHAGVCLLAALILALRGGRLTRSYQSGQPVPA
ncbi:MAG: MFS transporter [Spongiibacteraceae bacterium]|nr:MFS transporter [Spongiibacteraceae bacterium]